MNNNDVVFTTQPLSKCPELTKAMDRACFPEEMWLREQDFTDLVQRQARTILMWHKGELIGQAITLPETAAAAILTDVDPAFVARSDAAYSFSVAIVPTHQKQGYGVLLLQTVAAQLREAGYTAMSAHVRARHGWNEVRLKALPICSIRTVPDFWEDEEEVVQYQDARL